MERHKCACCEETIRPQKSACVGDPNTKYEGKPLCEICYYESELVATILYGRDKGSHTITSTRNETDGDYKVSWRSTDPWRGYYELSSDKYARIFSDAILSYHESEAMLKKLDDRVTAEFENRKIEYVRAFTRTSNVFSTGYDIWVRKDPEQILMAYSTLERIKKEVDFDNSLYSTGIVMDREAFGKLQSLLKGKYEVENDHDLTNLMAERGDELLGYIQKMHHEGGPHGD